MFQSHYDTRIRAILAARKRPPQAPQLPPEVLIPPSEPPDEIKKIIKERDQHRCLCCGEDNRGLLQIDHIKPIYYGGDHSPENLQTLCRICNRTKGIETINFLNHQATNAPFDFPKLILPQPQSISSSQDELKSYLRRSINFFYRCAAVESIGIRDGEWYINLYPGNNPDALQPHLVSLATDTQSAGFQNLREIRIQPFLSESHKVDKQSGYKSSLPSVKQPRKRRGSKKGLKLVPDGTLCYFKYDPKYEGKISNGQLIIGQKRYQSFSEASRAITGTKTERNGWLDWCLQLRGSNEWELAHKWREKISS